MFTGIVTDVGRIEKAERLNAGTRFRIATAYDPATIAIGASIACSGVCLTVTALPDAAGDAGDVGDARWFEAEAWEEALRLTTAGQWAHGTRVNLERALKMGDELGGHLVSGHVDGTADIIGVTQEGGATRFTLRAPAGLERFVAPKGSVALDGTSLTVNAVNGNAFDVLIIRHTQDVTTWRERREGDRVNFEADTMARYAARLAEASVSA